MSCGGLGRSNRIRTLPIFFFSPSRVAMKPETRGDIISMFPIVSTMKRGLANPTRGSFHGKYTSLGNRNFVVGNPTHTFLLEERLVRTIDIGRRLLRKKVGMDNGVKVIIHTNIKLVEFFFFAISSKFRSNIASAHTTRAAM